MKDLTITPARCTLAYSCSSVEYKAPGGASFSSVSSVKCTDFESTPNLATNKQMKLKTDQSTNKRYSGGTKSFKPGVYKVTLKAKVNGVTEVVGTTSKTFTYQFTLTDPCDPPTSLTVVDTANFDYTIADAAVTTSTKPFVITPSYCPFDVSIVIPTVSSESPTTQTSTNKVTGDVFSTSYSKDLKIKALTQTITRTATSKSAYTTKNTAKTKVDDFVITFKNPCINSSKVKVTAPAGANKGQTFAPDNKYGGQKTTYTLNPFTITPSICTITYKCSSVTPSTSSVLKCPSDFNTSKKLEFTL